MYRRPLKTNIPGIGQWEKAKTHCPKGHPYTKENTYLDKTSKKGKICRRCKICVRERRKIYQNNNYEKAIIAIKEYNENNPERVKYWDKLSTLKKHGLTLEDYNNILKKQNNKCAICKRKNPHGIDLAIDHNHKTGKIRGLLCTNCNTALGSFKDSTKTLQNAIEYLKNN
jgi:Recombination endonuclease VII